VGTCRKKVRVDMSAASVISPTVGFAHNLVPDPSPRMIAVVQQRAARVAAMRRVRITVQVHGYAL
jgi:hypothetical protein